MTLKAPPEYQKLGDSTEERMLGLVTKRLLERGSALSVRKGSEDARYNAEFGDIHVSTSDWEFPRAMVEVKYSGYPRSFSMSDVEWRTSKVHWVLVEGSLGVWAVRLEHAKEHGQHAMSGEGSDKHWKLYPRMEDIVGFDTLLDDIQVRCGEAPRSLSKSLLVAFNDKKP